MNNRILSIGRSRIISTIHRRKYSSLISGDNFLSSNKQLKIQGTTVKSWKHPKKRPAFGSSSKYNTFSTNAFQCERKIYKSASDALADVKLSGATICVGGFGLGGIPETLLDELSKIKDAKDLTVVSLTAGVDGFGLGLLFEAQKVKRLVASYVGENKVQIVAYLSISGFKTCLDSVSHIF